MSLIMTDGTDNNRVTIGFESLISQIQENPSQDIILTYNSHCPPVDQIRAQAIINERRRANQTMMLSESEDRPGPALGSAQRIAIIPSKKSTNSGFSMTTLFLSLIILLLVLRLNKII